MPVPGAATSPAPPDGPGLLIDKGRYVARLARTPADLDAAQRLRWTCFVARTGAPDDGTGRDADRLDGLCRHLLVEDCLTSGLVGCLRFLPVRCCEDIEQGYAARFHDLSRLVRLGMPMIEVGRFCVLPGRTDPDIIRTAWAALTRIVAETGARMLFGCSSFAGTDPAVHAGAFALLHARYLAPRRWRPDVRAGDAYPLSRATPPGPHDASRAMAGMPAILRSYLAMGGCVGDHAVIDNQLDTLHVFTAISIRSIPPIRRRLLSAAAR